MSTASFCGRCGMTAAGDGDRFCRRCGAELTPIAPAGAGESGEISLRPPAQRRIRWRYILAPIAIVAAAAATTALLLVPGAASITAPVAGLFASATPTATGTPTATPIPTATPRPTATATPAPTPTPASYTASPVGLAVPAGTSELVDLGFLTRGTRLEMLVDVAFNSRWSYLAGTPDIDIYVQRGADIAGSWTRRQSGARLDWVSPADGRYTLVVSNARSSMSMKHVNIQFLGR